LAVAEGLSVAEALLLVDGEGVFDAPSEAGPVRVLVVTCGLGVNTDVVGDPPPVQAATVTASTAAAAPAWPTRSSADGALFARAWWGRVSTGTVRRTFMKPPRMTGGQWRRSTHLSMCHPDRQGKSERAGNSPPFRPARIIPGASR
jgi:hypothetical protein